MLQKRIQRKTRSTETYNNDELNHISIEHGFVLLCMFLQRMLMKYINIEVVFDFCGFLLSPHFYSCHN